VRTYKVRLYNQDMQITLEETIEAPSMGEAMEKAKALKNDVNAVEHYRAEFVLKAITIHEQ